MKDNKERRQYERLPRAFRVEVSQFQFPLTTQPRIEVRCVDISAGGLKVESDTPFAAGSKVQVKVFIPGLNKFHPGFLKVFESDAGQYLQAIAEVMWNEDLGSGAGYSLGVRFLDVDGDDWKALAGMIRKQMSEGA